MLEGNPFEGHRRFTHALAETEVERDPRKAHSEDVFQLAPQLVPMYNFLGIDEPITRSDESAA